jgi:transcriptional regulator with XRE-family HTH domain
MVKRFHSALARRLGRNLAYYRRRAELTQERLAEAVQVETLTISRYETGATLPSLVTLEALSMLLCVSMADLLAEEAFPRSEGEERFLEMLEPLSSDERSTVIDALRTLTGFLRKQGSRPRKAHRADSRDLDAAT